MQGFLQIPRVKEMKTKLSCEVSFKFQELKRWKRSFRARRPSNSTSWRDENEAFVRGVLPIPRVEEMKTKPSCEASFKFQKLKRWKRSFRAWHPWNSESWIYENEAFVRLQQMMTRLADLLQQVLTRLEDLLRHVLTRLEYLLRHVLTRLDDLLRHVLTRLKIS